ncbi:hypothetical protein SARC_11123 [Sphaeroforma arctica JP610]|uniref:Uncharacterized protein n=1 Tax=Sphaeroforma arctica JP610 TaxID=667725 RepID=A0A0L0FJZ8_9EUKA|nr:hypothetical protein SARC_11123 [Sphaeroforma arctica JP610]KNC76373.1 hypothetical protein SARC_11123 [Sphaeroforma arctica JP610]|eukprot:XP_014150275.1 hypothetical protein SARC_11123 [Sphaeroforma arctica JP610]
MNIGLSKESLVAALSEASCLVNHTLLMQLLPSICSNTILPSTVIRLLSLESCSTIYHNVTVKETLENYNDCVGVNYNHFVSLMRQSSTQTKVIEPTPAVASVGMHFRWGDVRNKETKILDSATPVNKRGISVRSINQIWHNIEFVNCGGVEVKLYMQAHIPIKKGTFHFNYTVVDGNDWADLIDYQTNDIFIQGKSSWGIMGAFVNTGKVVSRHPQTQSTQTQSNMSSNIGKG